MKQISLLFVVCVGLGIAFPGVCLGSGCTATSTLGAECKANCGSGETPDCRSGVFRAKCRCLPGAATTSVRATGLSTGDFTLAVAVYDNSCETLPCGGVLVVETTVPIVGGETAVEVNHAVVSALEGLIPASCSVETFGGGDGFRMTCDDFMPKFRLCDAAVGSCPDVFEPGTGTDPDIGVDIGGLHFQVLEALDNPIPTLSEWAAIGMTLLLLTGATIVFFRKWRAETGLA